MHIREAFKGIDSKPDRYKAMAADAREEIDLRCGISFSKLISQEMRLAFKVDDHNFSYGPCIFPTLYFCYQRAREIERFGGETYWRGSITFKVSETKNLRIQIKNLD